MIPPIEVVLFNYIYLKKLNKSIILLFYWDVMIIL